MMNSSSLSLLLLSVFTIGGGHAHASCTGAYKYGLVADQLNASASALLLFEAPVFSGASGSPVVASQSRDGYMYALNKSGDINAGNSDNWEFGYVAFQDNSGLCQAGQVFTAQLIPTNGGEWHSTICPALLLSSYARSTNRIEFYNTRRDDVFHEFDPVNKTMGSMQLGNGEGPLGELMRCAPRNLSYYHLVDNM